MRTLVKICGLSSPDAVDTALREGASFIGFVFFERSPRNIKAATAARLAAGAASRGVKTVAVTVDPADDLLDEIVEALAPDLIQLHGVETPSRVVDVRRRTGAAVIKAATVGSAAEAAAAVRAFDGVADHLMFDARSPVPSPLPGGNGAAFDWSLLDGLRLERPWFLAGGLDPWNVQEAIRRTRAPQVDVSSGVERGAGLKDPALITAFLDAVRSA
jgi:phosphoribosylanthranilate isomerase